MARYDNAAKITIFIYEAGRIAEKLPGSGEKTMVFSLPCTPGNAGFLGVFDMARPRKKPGFDLKKEMEELINRVASEYGVYDDRDSDSKNGCYGKPAHTPSLNEVARKFGLNVTKTRKLLITAGAYSTAVSRLVQFLSDSGASVREIAERTGLSRSAVTSYLPYGRIVYRLNEVSPNADRLKLYRDRKRAVDELSAGVRRSGAGCGMDDVQKMVLWNAIELFQGYWFELEGMKFRYTLDRDGLYFTGWDMVVEKNAVDSAVEAAAGGSGKRDGCPACLYPLFERFGVYVVCDAGLYRAGDENL